MSIAVRTTVAVLYSAEFSLQNGGSSVPSVNNCRVTMF